MSSWQLTDGINLFGSLGLLDTQYKDYLSYAHSDADRHRGQERGPERDRDAQDACEEVLPQRLVVGRAGDVLDELLPYRLRPG